MKILYIPHCYSQQRQRQKRRKIYPVLLAMQAQYYRERGHEVYWNPDNTSGHYDKVITEPEDIPFRQLPPPDRIFTKWWEYQNNGNFKYLPGTYIMSASGCLWGRCLFCVESLKNSVFVRPSDSILEEIIQCHEMGFREIFDDSATFPDGEWLDAFCDDIIALKLPIRLGCNLRLDAKADYRKMREAGFRMVLFGLESINQDTLDRIHKGNIDVNRVESTLKKASEAGLEPHISYMVGYPWETPKDTMNTVRFVRKMLIKGYAKTAQSSYYNPLLKGNPEGEHLKKYLDRHYSAALNPIFWYNKFRDIKTREDIEYIWRGIKEGVKWMFRLES